MKKAIGLMMIASLAGLVCLTGCRYAKKRLPFSGYYSEDGKIAVEWPPQRDDRLDYTPVVVHRYGKREIVETNKCNMTEWGSSGNFVLESEDGTVILQDYSFCNNGDPSVIWTSIVFKKNSKKVEIPLTWIDNRR